MSYQKIIIFLTEELQMSPTAIVYTYGHSTQVLTTAVDYKVKNYPTVEKNGSQNKIMSASRR